MEGNFELGLAIIWYVALLVAVTCHEAAHAFAAWKLGDPTAYHGGQVTLDPLPHIRREPFGTVIMPIVSFIFMGWMVGWASTPYDPYWAQNNRRRAALMGLAGPTANLVLVVVAGLAVRLGMLLGYFKMPGAVTFTEVTIATSQGLLASLATVVSVFFSLNLILFVFNLIPLPPLDGSSVLTLFLSDRLAERYEQMVRRPGLRIFGLILAWNVVGIVLGPVHVLAVRVLYPGAGWH